MTDLGSKKPTPKFMGAVQDKMDNKSRSVRHEHRLQWTLRSKTTPNSGALPDISKKGDLQDGLFVWQAKLTQQNRFTITSDVLMEVCRQASLNGKWAGLVITLEGLDEHMEKDWVMLPASVFGELIDSYKID
jgi:hypothetical protein